MKEYAAKKRAQNDSIRYYAKHKAAGNPCLFAISIPFELHERFFQLQQAYLHGSPDWVSDLDAAIESMLSQGADPKTGKSFA
jgi:hypothetical protein